MAEWYVPVHHPFQRHPKITSQGTEKRGSFRGAFCMQKIKIVFSDYLSIICIFVGYIHLNNSCYGKI